MISYRKRLLASTVTTFIGGLALIAPQAASAQCVSGTTNVVNDTRNCGTTVTTDTTGTGPTDRNGQYSTATVPIFLNVTGAVTGAGLAYSPVASGPNQLTVNNSGSVTVNAGPAVTAGGSAAFQINAAGATPVVYTGNGSVTNLSAAGNGLEFNMTGTGSLNATVGGNVTSAVGGTGIFANGSTATGGNLSLTTLTGTTVRADFVGVYASIGQAANTGTVTVTNASTVGSLTGAPNTLDFGVYGRTDGLGAVSTTNNGAVGTATDRITNVGVGSLITNAGSTANVTLNGTGAVFGSNIGIYATNQGLGATNVNYTGAINTTGANGAEINSTSGTITATLGNVTAATNGVVVTSTTGTQTINANGVIVGTAGTGITSNTSGTRTITVGATGNVTGPTQAILLGGTGGGSVINSGTIGNASAQLAINAASATAPVTITNNVGGTINGRLATGTGADVVTNAGTINTQGLSDFGTGADLLTNSGTLTTTGATTLAGLETLNNTGTLNANLGLTFDGGATALTNTGTLNSAGTIDFGAGADSFANSGAGIFNLTASTTLVGLETFSNSGRINLNTFTLTGPAIAFNNTGFIDTNGSAALAGFTSFSNAGTLDLAAGTFTVPAVVFTNTGLILADEGASTITGQTSFANSGTIDLQDGATGDVLTINSTFAGSGGSNLLVDFDDTQSDRLVTLAASGSTTVNANFVGVGLIDVDGVLVVDTTATTANAFILGSVGGNTSPLVDYNLVQVGQDFFLTSTPNPEAFDPVAISNLASSIWYQSADEVVAQTDLPSGLEGFGAWGQVYYSQDKFGDDDEVAVIDGVAFAVDNELKTDRYGVQLGVEYGFGGARLGLTGGYGVAKSDNDLNNDLKAKGWNIGVYGAFGGLTGFHGSALLKHDRYDLEFDGGAFEGFDGDLTATGVDGSLGYRFGIGGAATLDAKVGLAHVRTKVDDITAFGFNYDIGTVTSTRGRAGVRASFGGNLGFYAEGMVLREFDGDGNVELFDGATFYDIDSDGKGTWFRLEAGLAPQLGSGPILAAWADLGDKKGFGIRAGFRFGGARVEEALPPPPPPVYVAPPPPPPAPQTCSDGSVILATDMCPPPPPPPPPPPEPERG